MKAELNVYYRIRDDLDLYWAMGGGWNGWPVNSQRFSTRDAAKETLAMVRWNNPSARVVRVTVKRLKKSKRRRLR